MTILKSEVEAVSTHPNQVLIKEKKRTLIIIAGRSGSGKTTAANKLAEDPEVTKIITSTTRQPREGEVHNKDYYFISRQLFEAERDEGNFFEWTEYNGNYYGIHGQAIEYVLNKKKTHGVVVVDIKGMKAIKEHCQNKGYNAFSFWFTTHSLASVIKNMRVGGLSDTDIVNKLIADSRNEDDRLNCIGLIDAVIETDILPLDKHVEQIKKWVKQWLK